MMEGTGDIYFISHLMSNPILTVFFCMYCAAVPRIPRPSDKQFLKYAKEGKTEQVAEALLHYPDLVHVKDGVSDLCYCDEGHFPSLCDCLLCVSTLDDICRHPSTLHHYPIISSSTVMIQFSIF